MGLDQWLTAKKFLWTDSVKDKERTEEIKDIIDVDKSLEIGRVKEISFELTSWRKANHIHKWFVDNVQEGEDDCKEYGVSMEQLQELLDVINEILGTNIKEKIVHSLKDGFDKEKAEKLLPTQSGFFYGGTDYDEYYLEELKDTQEFLTKLLKNKDKFEDLDIYYSSSW